MTAPPAGRAESSGPPRRSGRASLPTQRTLLTWLLAGRLVLVLATLLGASLVWTERPDVAFIATVAVVFALTFTSYGAWALFVRHRLPSSGFLQVCLLYTSPSPRDISGSRMPSSA